jgi:hypothetical protein
MKNRCINKITFAIILFSFAHLGFAATASIRGSVLSGIDSLAIGNAHVYLFNSDSVLIKTTVSNSTGIFEFENLQISNSANCYLRISKEEFRDSYVAISGGRSNINVGTIYLIPFVIELKEISVSSSNMIEKVDKTIVFPTSFQVKASPGSMDLLRNLNLPNLNIDIINQRASIDGLAPVYQINGRPQSREQILGIKPSDIARIEYSNTVPIRYMNQNTGGVINFILRERASGGSFFANATASPFTGFLNGVASTGFNHKKSDFSILYNTGWRDYTKRYINNNESLIADREIISRDFTGKYSPFGYLSQDLNFNYTYQHDSKTMLSIIVGNSFGSQHDESKSDVSLRSSYSNEEFYRESNAYFDSYSPSLDIFFSKKLEKNQAIEFNAVGTMLNSTYKRQLYDDGALQS